MLRFEFLKKTNPSYSSASYNVVVHPVLVYRRSRNCKTSCRFGRRSHRNRPTIKLGMTCVVELLRPLEACEQPETRGENPPDTVRVIEEEMAFLPSNLY
jgi:hypothetical protein